MNPVPSLSTIEVIMVFVLQDESYYAQHMAHTDTTRSTEF